MFDRIIRCIGGKIKKKIFPRQYTKLEKEFIYFNRKEWMAGEHTRSGSILVYISDSPLRCIIEAMLLAKKLEEVTGKTLIIGLEADENVTTSKKEIYESFNVNKFVNVYTFKYTIFFKAIYMSLLAFIRIKSPKDILETKFASVPIGEEIYDSILRFDKNTYTVTSVKWKYYYYYYKIFYQMILCKWIYKKYQIDTLIFSDIDYVPRCAFSKMAIDLHIDMYYSDTGRYINYTSHNTSFKLRHPFAPTKKEWEDCCSYENILDKADEYLKLRFTGESLKQHDRHAFLGKTKYDKKTLFRCLGIVENHKKNIFVAAHAFSDLNHYGNQFIFQDYYHWLIETLKLLEENSNINVFLKVHPSIYRFNEENLVAEFLKKLRKNSDVFILPNDFNTASLVNIADAIITCQGTVGLEMSCFGIPCFTASHGYYSGFEIDISSSSLEEYKHNMRNIDQFGRIETSRQNRAKILLYLIYVEMNKCMPEVFPEDRFEDDKYWIYPEKQYEYIVQQIKKGFCMKDSYYDNLLQYIVEQKN